MFTFSGDLAAAMAIGFCVVSIFYVIFSVVLYYHWVEYAVEEKVRTLSLFIYFFTTLPLLALMGVMILLV